MRTLRLSLLAAGIAAIPCAAFSQEDQPRSVEDYVCAFAGECPEEATEESAEEPAGRPGGPRVTATRGFSLSTPGSARPRRPAPTARGQRRPTQTAAPRRPAAAQGQRVNLRLSFESGSARLTAAAEAEARIFGQSLMLPQLANMRFRIEGHTDSVGTRASNLTLSQRRAQSVADYLAAMGVPRERLEVVGYGPDRPMPGTRGTAGENRRVEAVRVS
ncbi:MAG TPA: OmpA family protein [Allosphingosinicella sp.]|nr:OmpA family protein [Allosphingosinicella sp.]